ncbi:DUF4440 domain-containing protein [Novosphingobium sp. M1R2S20]|uniref:DUF4440 domain-containing protein n=1 Tax=Novosphingobium rhizovicinum TaxID=3228928 RepID=A0ABV3RA68_9SPHN
MEDERIWDFERELWVGGDAVYRERVSEDCLMALPGEPFLFGGDEAAKAVEQTPRWRDVRFCEQRVSRPQEGLIVIAYRVEAQKEEGSYHALCTTTLRRRAHEEWDVVQHQQTPLGMMVADPRQT